MIIGRQITTLRTALQHALDELHRVNASHACVRPDVTYAAMEALRNTFVAPIKNASPVEQQIVGKLITDILNRDLLVSVWEGGDYAIKNSRDAKAIYEALASTDTDQVYVMRADSPHPIGWVLLVWGNDCDIISNYTVTPTIEDLLAGANALADELEG